MRPRLQLIEAPIRQNRRLVRLQHDLQEAIEIGELRLVRVLQLLDEAVVAALAVLLQEFRALAPELPFRGAANEGVSMPHETQVGGIELLRLDQHLLAHADLAEIVEQGGVADLLQLLARELHQSVGAVRRAIDDLGETDRHAGDSARVTVRGRVALLDRVDRCQHEPLEQPFDVLVQAAVFAGAGGSVAASAVTSSTVRLEYGTTCLSTSAGVASTASRLRLRLMSCSTPMISSL